MYTDLWFSKVSEQSQRFVLALPFVVLCIPSSLVVTYTPSFTINVDATDGNSIEMKVANTFGYSKTIFDSGKNMNRGDSANIIVVTSGTKKP